MIIIAKIVTIIFIGIFALISEIKTSLKNNTESSILSFCWILYSLLLCAFGFFFFGLCLLILNEIKAKNREKYESNNFLYYADNIVSLFCISYPLIQFIQLLSLKIITII